MGERIDGRVVVVSWSDGKVTRTKQLVHAPMAVNVNHSVPISANDFVDDEHTYGSQLQALLHPGPGARTGPGTSAKKSAKKPAGTSGNSKER